MQICFWKLKLYASGVFVSLERIAAEIENWCGCRPSSYKMSLLTDANESYKHFRSMVY
jgi:hypothetical protein